MGLRNLKNKLIGNKTKNKKEKEANDIVKKMQTTLGQYRKQFEPNWKREEKAYYGDIWENTTDYKPYENGVLK